MVPETLPCIRNRNGLREKMKRYYYFATILSDDRSIVVHKNKVAKDNPTRKTQHNTTNNKHNNMTCLPGAMIPVH